jgi:trigger factor
MSIAIEPKKSDGAQRHIQVTIPVAMVNEATQKAARKLAARVSIPGFRPGKAPAAMVMKRYGESIRAEALDHLVQDAYREVLDREQIKAASQPHIHDLRFEEGEPVSFELHVEVRPEIVLARTQGFRVSRSERAVSDEEVSEQLEQMREQRASWVPVEGRPVEGDLVTVMLATADDSGEMPEGKEYKIVLGAGHAIPGIEEVIMDLSPGETLERPVRWPDDFPDEAQRGTSKAVRVSLGEVKRKSLPALDDAFAREIGDFDSLVALRSAVRSDMIDHARRDADAEVRQKLVDEIIGANPFEVPPSWVGQLIEGYAKAYQIPEAELERFATQFRPTAERQVRRDLIIETLAENEKLKAGESDIDEKITELAEKRGQNPGQVYATLQKGGRLAELERGLTEDKVFKWLFERNTIE